MTNSQTEYWIATDLEKNAIQAIAHSEARAIDEMIADAGPFRNREGDEIYGDEARAQCISMPCSVALYEQVEAEGGAISWGENADVAVTDAEHVEAVATKLIDAAWATANAKWAESVAHRRVHFEGGEGYDPYEEEAERLSMVASKLEYALVEKDPTK